MIWSWGGIFGSIKMEKLTVTFRAIFSLFWHHEIHQTALATSCHQNLCSFIDIAFRRRFVLLLFSWRWFRRRSFAVVATIIFLRIVKLAIYIRIYPRIFLWFHPCPPVYEIYLPSLKRPKKKKTSEKLWCLTCIDIHLSKPYLHHQI